MLHQNFRLWYDEYRPATLLLALSGGRDSVALFHLLRLGGYGFGAAYLNHGWSAAGAQWGDFCAALCARHGVPFQREDLHLSAGPNAEAQARTARYERLAALLPERGVLLTGHQRDDQLETFFLQLQRGAGLDGLAAMPERKRFGRGEHWRPLLGVARADISARCAAEGWAYLDDPSNGDERFARNQLRRRLLPTLRALGPGWDGALARSIGHLGEALEVQKSLLDRRLAEALGRGGVLPWARLCEREGLPLAKALLRRWLQRLGWPPVPEKRLLSFSEALRSGRGELVAAGGRLLAAGGNIYVDGPLGAPPPLAPTVDWPGLGRLTLTAEPAALAGLRWALYPQSASYWAPGTPGPQSLKNFFQNQGIDAQARRRLPLLLRGARCLWLGDFGPAADAQNLRVCWKKSPAPGAVFA